MALHPFHAAILGLVEGITEYLPVSSTGHLIIASALLMPEQDAEMKRNLAAFEIVIQGGAILAVLGLYWQRVVQMLRGIAGRDATGLRLARNIAVAFLPAAFVGVLLKDVIEQRLFYPVPVMGALLVGGIIMILIGRRQEALFRAAPDVNSDRADSHAWTDIEHLSWNSALIIGLLQCLAIWPGTSRSMVTLVGGMLVGMKPRHAAEFSFLLGLPTLGGACVYSAYTNFAHDGPDMIETLGVSAIVIGIVVATVSATIAIKWLVSFLTRHGLAVFGWYRIALCIVLGVLIWKGVLTIEPDDANASEARQANPIAPD